MTKNTDTASSSPRVLVAGATGYLGGFVAREFKARGCNVRIAVRSPQKVDPSLVEVVDDVVAAQVTDPPTLRGICNNVDIVFSSVGITRQKDGLTFRDVDYQGNKNLLEEAMATGTVRKFVYVSVLHGRDISKSLDIARAHEDFVTHLAASGLDYVVVRPSGYFSDLGEILDMARSGRVYLMGDGTCKANPIHGADLAVACVDAALDESKTRSEMDVGGPDVLSWNQVGDLAFAALEKQQPDEADNKDASSSSTPSKPVVRRITHLPSWLVWTIIRIVGVFNRHESQLMAFFGTVSTMDLVASNSVGTHRLANHFCNVVKESNQQKAMEAQKTKE